MKTPSKKHRIAVDVAWVPVPLDFLRSRACAELSPLALKLLIDLLALLGPNARGNGDLSLTFKSMRARGWKSNFSLHAALNELMEFGLVAKTRQGSRLGCSLFAVTLYPLDCDLGKLDVSPGCYLRTDYMQGGALAIPPTEDSPAEWRQPRKIKKGRPLGVRLVSETYPQGTFVENKCTKIVQNVPQGYENGVFRVSNVPPGATFIDLPSVGEFSEPFTKVTGSAGDPEIEEGIAPPKGEPDAGEEENASAPREFPREGGEKLRAAREKKNGGAPQTPWDGLELSLPNEEPLASHLGSPVANERVRPAPSPTADWGNAPERLPGANKGVCSLAGGNPKGKAGESPQWGDSAGLQAIFGVGDTLEGDSRGLEAIFSRRRYNLPLAEKNRLSAIAGALAAVYVSGPSLRMAT